MVMTWKERLEKKAPHVLSADEVFKAGAVLQLDGQMSKQMWFGVFGIVGTLIAEAWRKSRSPTLGAPVDLAQTLPRSGVVGLTNKRLLFFKSVASKNLMRPAAEVALTEVSSFSGGDSGMARDFQLVFSDGSSASYEIVKGSKPDLFFDALEQTVSRLPIGLSDA